MGLTSSYPDDLDNIDDILYKKVSRTRDPQTDNNILLDGFINATCSTLIIPKCLINLIIKYFAITHCIMLYSRNDDNKRGKIDIIDLNQNVDSLSNILSLKNSVHLNHKMHCPICESY